MGLIVQTVGLSGITPLVKTVVVPEGAVSLSAVAVILATATESKIAVSAKKTDTWSVITGGTATGLIAISGELFPSVPVLAGEEYYLVSNSQGSAVMYWNDI
jgi:hypothetical protein